MAPEEEKQYREARRRVKHKKNFYSALIMYFAICTLLTLFNWFTERNKEDIHWWVLWVWGGWGIGMLFYSLSFFKRDVLFSKEWEERKIKEEMEKMKRQ